MASPLAHGLVAYVIGTVFPRPRTSRRYGAAILGSILPDVDVLGYQLGIPYESWFGHRGFTHSIAFAVALGGLLTWLLFTDESRFGSRRRTWLYLSTAVASHGVLDAMTAGGLGVAFFSPFSNERYLFPWRPVPAGPLSIGSVFTFQMLEVFRAEAIWIAMPCSAFLLAVGGIRVVRALRDPAAVGRKRKAVAFAALVLLVSLASWWFLDATRDRSLTSIDHSDWIATRIRSPDGALEARIWQPRSQGNFSCTVALARRASEKEKTIYMFRSGHSVHVEWPDDRTLQVTDESSQPGDEGMILRGFVQFDAIGVRIVFRGAAFTASGN